MYDGRLTTFPGTAIDSAVVFEPVDGQAVVQAGVDTIETTDGEVARVVELVLAARPHPSHTSRSVSSPSASSTPTGSTRP